MVLEFLEIKRKHPKIDLNNDLIGIIGILSNKCLNKYVTPISRSELELNIFQSM